MIVIPNSKVRLLSAVPFNHTYEHIRTFSNETDQYNYFSTLPSKYYTDLTYQREEIAVKIPEGYDKLINYNYLMYQNTEFGGKWFYAFIIKKEYVNPDTTRIYFQLDVFQTWQFNFNWNPSFVIREHRDRWNGDGSPVVNTVDEGLNYGTDYKTVNITQVVPHTDVFFLVMACQRRMDVNSDKIEPNLNGSIQPLTYYVHPFRMNGTVPTITVDGQNQTLSPIADVLKALYTSTVTVNNIASLYITEYIGHDSLNFSMAEFEPVNIQDDTDSNFVTLRVKNMPQYRTMVKGQGDKYSGFSSVTESKLLMYPYTVTILTDMKGNQREIKNEYIEGQNLDIHIKGSIGTNNKVSYHINNYLMGDITNSGEIALEHAIINNNPNDVPIITDLLSAYLQGNRNAIQNQKSSILFNQAMGVTSSAVGGSILGTVSSAGHGYLEMAGLLAKQKDIANTPPSISSMGGNTAFDYGNDIKGMYIIKKEITSEYRQKLTDYFRLYGYKTNELKIPNIKTRNSFNFVHVSQANITGDVPNEDLTEIKGIFERGVTLWHGDWVLNFDRDNNEI
jgi:hypothetical protein